MKNNKINLISLIVNTFIFLVLIFVSLSYFYPEIMNIENKKWNLLKLQNNYKDLNSNWLSYINFKKIHLPETTNYEKRILFKIWHDFYSKNFINSDGKFKLYKDFLNNLDQDIKWKLKKDYDKKHNQIYSIIPIYVEWINDINSETLSDFKFINNIEQLLYDNNLTTNSQIWIKSLDKVKDYSENSKVKSDLGSDIYSITLPLSIKGKKKNIINFLQEIYNMWIVHKWNIKKGEPDLVITNSNNFVEVDSIKMDKYIDDLPSLSVQDKDKSLIQLLKTSKEKDDDFKMDVKLVFYVQWLPNYKIKQDILNVVWNISEDLKKSLSKKQLEELDSTNYNYIISKVKTLESLNKKDKLILIQLNEIDSYLKWLDSKMKLIVKDTNLDKNLLKNYNYIQRLKTVFSIINQKLEWFTKK